MSEPSEDFGLVKTLFHQIVKVNIDITPISSPTDGKLKGGVMAKSRAESQFSFSVGNVNRGNITVAEAPDFNSYRYGIKAT